MKLRMAFRSVAGLLLVLITLAFSGCPGPSSGNTYVVRISASAGTLSQAGSNWSFDAGAVPQYTTENITFTLTNTGSAAFTAQGTVSFTNSDFSTNLSGSFTVPAGSSNTFVGSFTPINGSGQETGTLTLTPTSGNPIVINLKGTADKSFQLLDPNSTQIQNATVYSFGCNSGTLTITNNSTAAVTLTGNPTISVVGNSDPVNNLPPQFQQVTSTSPWTFDIGGGGASTATVTITGTDSANSNGNFTFSFSIDDTGCS